jgi:ComF family protein
MSPVLSGLFGRPRLTDIEQACALCEATSRGAVCAACADNLPRTQHGLTCQVCAIPGASNAVCGQCLRDPPHFDASVAAFHYQYPFDKLVQSFKFGADLKLVQFFASALAQTVSLLHTQAEAFPQIVVALPLANQRLKERGFNQSALLAAGVANQLKLPVAHGAMLRIRETPPQSGLNREARIKNIRGAFACDTSLVGKSVAIVDDVMTTGATLSEAARILKSAGACRVEAWVLARAISERN